MQDVKLGKSFDDAGESISDVEKTLKRFGIETRDQNLEFRNTGDVIDEVAAKWETFSKVEQSSIAKALAGVRQRENLLTLFSNYEKVGTMLDQESKAEGLAQERMKAYYESVEGHANKLKTDWDAIWTSQAWADFLKGWYSWLDVYVKLIGGGAKAPKTEDTLNNLKEKLKKEEDVYANLPTRTTVWGMTYKKGGTEQQKAIDDLKQQIYDLEGALAPATDKFQQMADIGEEAFNTLAAASEDAANGVEMFAQSQDAAEDKAIKQGIGLTDLSGTIRGLIDDYDEVNGLTLEQISSLQALWPEQYNYLTSIDQTTGATYLNKEALRQLTIEKINDAIKTIEAALANDKLNVSLQNVLAIAKAYLGQVQQTTYWLPKMGAASSSAAKQVSDNEKAYQDLIKMTIDMLKDKANAEKDALKEELDGYKDIIDARKKILDQMKEEKNYQDDLAEKNKELSNIENELLELQFDNSEEAKAKRLLLEDEKAKKLKEIDKSQYDKSIDDQKEALDVEYDNYKDYIDNKIKELDNYLSASGDLTNEAIDLLAEKSAFFYQELIEWNHKFGTGVDTDVTGKWTTAFNSIITYSGGAVGAIGSVTDAVNGLGDALDNLTWQEIPEGYGLPSDWMTKTTSTTPTPTNKWDWQAENAGSFDSGGIVGGLPKLQSGQKFAQVMDGEHMSTPSQIEQFINSTLPNIISMASGGGGTTINMPISVAGSLDKSVLPELKSTILDTVNKAMKSRGMKRTVGSFSV
jgi:hypothetical protein